jgi:hypothetical protein
MPMRLGSVVVLYVLCGCAASSGKKPSDSGGGGGADETGGSTGGGTGGKATGGTVGSTGGMVGSTGGGGPAGSGGGGSTVPDAAAMADSGTVRMDAAVDQPKFSFFVTSLVAMRRLSKSQNGFGGDLRYGTADGLTGADKICTEIADFVRAGAGAKGWRAFLSASTGPAGMPVNAIDRIGEGPWYDFMGRIVAMNKAALLNPRPMGAHTAIINDLPNENGIPNQRPDLSMPAVDNHHVLTGSDTMGRFYSANSNCKDWTALTGAGRPRIGFSWPAGGRQHWISGQDEGGCGAGVNVAQTGGSDPSNPIVGSGGGYGGIYCFALVP